MVYIWYTYKFVTKIGKERGNSYQKMKRSLDEGHTQTHGSLIETFQQSQMVKTAPHESFGEVSPERVLDRKGGRMEGDLNGNHLRY